MQLSEPQDATDEGAGTSQLPGGIMEAHRAVSRSKRRLSAPQDAMEEGAGTSQLPGKGIRESLAQLMGCNAPASAGDL